MRGDGNRGRGACRPTAMNVAKLAVVGVVVAATLLATCGGTTAAADEYAVTGTAHAGPVCPVQHDPPDPACADRPVDGAVLLIVDDAGRTVAETRTDADGHFTTELPAGNYTLVPQPVEGLPGTAQPQTFTTGRGLAPALDVAYGTGIR